MKQLFLRLNAPVLHVKYYTRDQCPHKLLWCSVTEGKYNKTNGKMLL